MARADALPVILFRCDGTLQTGLGHSSRCLALAEALVDLGCECAFLGEFDATVGTRIESAGMRCLALDASAWTTRDADRTGEMAKRIGAVGIVLDSYLIDVRFLEQLATHAVPVATIDDFAALPAYPCAAIVNFTSLAEELRYPQGNAKRFLGIRWFMARQPLRRLRASGTRRGSTVTNVLVAAGGHDPHDIVVPVVEALTARPRDLSLRVVVGTDYKHRDRVERLLAGIHGETTILDTLPDLAAQFEWAGACISSGGLTKYEAAYLGVPSAVLSQNDGQANDSARFATLGLIRDLGPAADADSTSLAAGVDEFLENTTLRESMSSRGRALFPVDPTGDLARALLAEVFTDRQSAR